MGFGFTRWGVVALGLRHLLIGGFMVCPRGFELPFQNVPPLLSPMILSDAAIMGPPASGLFRGGGFSPILGGKSFVMCLPNSLLQVAEVVALVRGLRIGSFEGFESCEYVFLNVFVSQDTFTLGFLEFRSESPFILFWSAFACGAREFRLTRHRNISLRSNKTDRGMEVGPAVLFLMLVCNFSNT